MFMYICKYLHDDSGGVFCNAHVPISLQDAEIHSSGLRHPGELRSGECRRSPGRQQPSQCMGKATLFLRRLMPLSHHQSRVSICVMKVYSLVSSCCTCRWAQPLSVLVNKVWRVAAIALPLQLPIMLWVQANSRIHEKYTQRSKKSICLGVEIFVVTARLRRVTVHLSERMGTIRAGQQCFHSCWHLHVKCKTP